MEKKFYIPDDISKEKVEAILHSNGPLMIIAGPGSGKTTTILWHIIKLLFLDNTSPKKIWATTFTKKTAENLILGITRVIRQLNIDINISEMLIGTIHSTCLHLMNEY